MRGFKTQSSYQFGVYRFLHSTGSFLVVPDTTDGSKKQSPVSRLKQPQLFRGEFSRVISP
jgi:hypothetical protein